jgi:hypothetical protein
METDICIKNIQKDSNKIRIDFDCSDKIEKYFNRDKSFILEYISKEELSIDQIPDNILVIPFLCNILPVSWLLNITIHINELDKIFYESIDDFKNGYIKMYPSLEFNGKLMVDKIIENYADNNSGKNLLFFSGGVDAFNSLINHYGERPVLMTIWGSDVRIKNLNGWKNTEEHINRIVSEFDLENIIIKSNFREFLNEDNLTRFIRKKTNGNWWHEFQHGIGIIGHAAPLAYLYNTKTVYIASSFTQEDYGIVTCASDPTIDNKVKFIRSNIIHDGYEYTRQEKLKNICSFTDKRIQLRVCFSSTDGKNCNKCEKCYRTMMGILAEGKEPIEYGVLYNKKKGNEIKIFIKYKYFMDFVQKAYWKDIKKRFQQNKELIIDYPELGWIMNIDFTQINNNIIKIFYNKIIELLRIIKKQIKIIRRLYEN